jgi:hypothetical protein
VYGRERLAKF